MSKDMPFDALELARMANPEIDDLRRAPLSDVCSRPSAEAANTRATMIIRLWRSLWKQLNG